MANRWPYPYLLLSSKLLAFAAHFVSVMTSISIFYFALKIAGTHLAGYTGFRLRLDNMTNVYFGDDKENILAIHVDARSGTGWWYGWSK